MQSKLQQLETKYCVGWQEYRIDKVFQIIKTNKVIENKNGDLPATTAGWANNQLTKRVNKGGTTVLKDVISVTANGMGRAFYQPHNFTVLQDSYAIQFVDGYKNSQNRETLIYAVGALNKTIIGKYDYNNKSGWNRIKTDTITLPTSNGEIAFDYMEEVIATLEEERLQTLDAYLSAAGLKDYTLTPEEQSALDDIETIKYGEFNMKELFNVKGNPQLNKESFTFSEQGEYPYFTRTVSNNGIAGYVDYLDENHKIKGNSIAVGMLGMQFFYMNSDFYSGQFTKTLSPTFNGFNDKIALYFITFLNKNQQKYQDSLVRDFETLFYETKASLPIIPNGTPDYDFMSTYIRVVQKLVIKCVVEWKDGRIMATKGIVG